MAKESIALGVKTTEGKEYKTMKPYQFGGWAVFIRVTYPSGDHAFWQQVSKEYQYKKCAFNHMLKRAGIK